MSQSFTYLVLKTFAFQKGEQESKEVIFPPPLPHPGPKDHIVLAQEEF